MSTSISGSEATINTTAITADTANHGDAKSLQRKRVAPSLCGGRAHFFPPEYVEFVDHNVRDSLEKSALLLIHFGYADPYLESEEASKEASGTVADSSFSSKTAQTRSQIRTMCKREVRQKSEEVSAEEHRGAEPADETGAPRVELFDGLSVPLLKPIEPFTGSLELTAALEGIYASAGFAWCPTLPLSNAPAHDGDTTSATASINTSAVSDVPPFTGRDGAAVRFEKGVEAVLQLREKSGPLQFDSQVRMDEELAERVESFVEVAKGYLRRCQSSPAIPTYIRKYLLPLLFSWSIDWDFAQRCTSLWKGVVSAFVHSAHSGKFLRGGNALTLPWKPLLCMLEASGEQDVNNSYSGHHTVRSLCRSAAPYLEADAFVNIWAYIAPQLSITNTDFGWSMDEFRLFLPALRLKTQAEKDVLRQIVELLLNASVGSDGNVERSNQSDVWSFLQAGLQRSKGDLEFVESLAETLFTCYLRVSVLKNYVLKGSLEKRGPQHWIRRANSFFGEALPAKTDSPFWNQLRRFLRWIELRQESQWHRQIFHTFVKDITQTVQKRLYWQRAKTRKQQAAEDDDAPSGEEERQNKSTGDGNESMQNRIKEEIMKKVQQAKGATEEDGGENAPAAGTDANFADTYDVAVAFYEDTDDDDDDDYDDDGERKKKLPDGETPEEVADRSQRQADWSDETCAAFVDLLAPMLLPSMYVAGAPRASLASSMETLVTIHPEKTLQYVLPYLLEGFKGEATGDMFMVSLRLLQMTMTMARGRTGCSVSSDESDMSDVDKLWNCVVTVIPTLPERMSANNARQFQLIAQIISQFSASFPFSSLFRRSNAGSGSNEADPRSVDAEIEFVAVLMDKIESVCQDSSNVKSNQFGSVFGGMQTWFEAMHPEALHRSTERVCRLVRTLGTPAQAKLTQYLVYQAVAASPTRMLPQMLPALRDNIVHRAASLTASALQTEKHEMGWDVTMMCAAVRGGGAASFAFRNVVAECIDALLQHLCKDTSADFASKLFASLFSSSAVRAVGVVEHVGAASTTAPHGKCYTPGSFHVQWTRPTFAQFEFLLELHDRLVYDTFTRIRAVVAKPVMQDKEKPQSPNGVTGGERSINFIALRELLQFLEVLERVSTPLHEARTYLSEDLSRPPMEAIRTFPVTTGGDALRTPIAFRGQITCPSMDAIFLTLAGRGGGAAEPAPRDKKVLEPCTRSAVQRFLIHEVVPHLLDDDGIARFRGICGETPAKPTPFTTSGSTRCTDQYCKAACLQTIGFLVQSARSIQLPYQFMDISASMHWKRLAHTVMVKEDGMPAAFWLHGSRAAIHFVAGPRVQPVVTPSDFTESLYVTLGFSGETNMKDMVRNSHLMYKSLFGLSDEGVRVWCKSRQGLLSHIAQNVRAAAEQHLLSGIVKDNKANGQVDSATGDVKGDAGEPTPTADEEELARTSPPSKERSTAVKLGTKKIIESVVKALTSLSTMTVVAWSQKQLDVAEDFVNVLLAVPDEYLDNMQFLVIKTIIQHTGTVLRQVPVTSQQALSLVEKLIAVAGVTVSKAVPRATLWLNFAYDMYTPSPDFFLSASAVRTLFRLTEYSHAELHKKALLFLKVIMRPSEGLDKQWVIRMLPENVARPWSNDPSCTSPESVVKAASEAQFFSAPSAARVECYFKEYTRLTQAWPGVNIIGEWRGGFPAEYLHVSAPRKSDHIVWTGNAPDGTIVIGGETFKLIIPGIPSYPQLMDPRFSKPPKWCFSTAEQASEIELVEDDRIVSLRHAIRVASGSDALHTNSKAVMQYAALTSGTDAATNLNPTTVSKNTPAFGAGCTELQDSWLYKMTDNFDAPAFNEGNVSTLQHLSTSLSAEYFAPVVLATADVLIARLEGGTASAVPLKNEAADATPPPMKQMTAVLTTDEQTHAYGAVMEFLVSILTAEGKCTPARGLAMSKLYAMCLYACRSSSPNGVVSACSEALDILSTELRWYEAEQLVVGLCAALTRNTSDSDGSYALCGTIEQCRALSLVTATVPLLPTGVLVHVLPKLLAETRSSVRHLLDAESTLVQISAGRCIHSILRLCFEVEALYDPTGDIARTSVEIARDILKGFTLPVYEAVAITGKNGEHASAHTSVRQHHLNRGYALLASIRSIPFRFLCVSLDGSDTETPSSEKKLASIALHSSNNNNNSNSKAGAAEPTATVAAPSRFLLSTCLLLLAHDVNCEYEELKSLQRSADGAIMEQACQLVPKDVFLDAVDTLCKAILSGMIPVDPFPDSEVNEAEEGKGGKDRNTSDVPAGKNAFLSMGGALLLLVKLNYNRLGKYTRFVSLFDASAALLRHVDTDVQKRGKHLAELLTAAASSEQMMELTKRYQITLTTRSKQAKELRSERQASGASSPQPQQAAQSQLGELERDRQAHAAVLGASLCVAQPRLPAYAPRVMRCLLQLSDDSNALLCRIVRSVLGEWWRYHNLLIAFSHKDEFSAEVLEKLKQVCFSQQYLA